jgi:hypothetical protein
MFQNTYAFFASPLKKHKCSGTYIFYLLTPPPRPSRCRVYQFFYLISFSEGVGCVGTLHMTSDIFAKRYIEHLFFLLSSLGMWLKVSRWNWLTGWLTFYISLYIFLIANDMIIFNKIVSLRYTRTSISVTVYLTPWLVALDDFYVYEDLHYILDPTSYIGVDWRSYILQIFTHTEAQSTYSHLKKSVQSWEWRGHDPSGYSTVRWATIQATILGSNLCCLSFSQWHPPFLTGIIIEGMPKLIGTSTIT